MSAIGPTGNEPINSSIRSDYHEQSRVSGNTPSSGQTANEISHPLGAGDSVEISAESLEKSREWRISRVSEQREEFVASIREKLESLVSSKRDLDGHINAVLKEAGIKLSDGEKLRVETGSNGKISVGGIDDKDKRKKIEDALNNESGLAKKVQDYNKSYRKVSSELKSDTGLSLQQLILEQQRKRQPDATVTEEGVEEGENGGIGLNKGLDQFALFSENSDLQDMVKELGHSSNVVYAPDCKAASEPEATIKNLLTEAKNKVQEWMDGKNDEFRETMKNAGVPIDEETKKDFLFSLADINISVGSDGSIEIEGMTAGNADRDKMAKDAIKEIFTSMMQKRDDSNTVVLFEEANERLLEDYELAFGNAAADDARIISTIGKASVTGEIRLSSPSKEKELDETIGQQANALVNNMVDFEITTPFEFEVNQDGKLSVANMPENELERKQLENALEIINLNLKKEDGDDKTYSGLSQAIEHRRSFMPGKLGSMIDVKNRDRDTGPTTVTEYSPAGALADMPQTAVSFG